MKETSLLITVDVGEDQVDCWIDVEYTLHKCSSDEYPGYDHFEVDSINLTKGQEVWLEEGGRNLENADIQAAKDDIMCDWFYDQLEEEESRDDREYEPEYY